MAATPTLRTLDSFKGYLENTKTVVVGDRLKDINWVGINVNKQNYLSDGYRDGNQNKIADLSNLSVHKQGEKGNLLWNDPNFGINVNWQYPDGRALSRPARTPPALSLRWTRTRLRSRSFRPQLPPARRSLLTAKPQHRARLMWASSRTV